MEWIIYHGNSRSGTMTAEDEGLYWRFRCRMTEPGLQRVYVLSGGRSEYLGIPDASGLLKARLAKKHLPEGITGAVACTEPRGMWKPWRGEADGRLLEQAWVSDTALALTQEEAADFPLWLEHLRTETVRGELRYLLPLSLLWDDKMH